MILFIQTLILAGALLAPITWHLINRMRFLLRQRLIAQNERRWADEFGYGMNALVLSVPLGLIIGLYFIALLWAYYNG